MKIRNRFWHGVGTVAAWADLQKNGVLRLPEAGGHLHDPGDYGLAVYLTSSRARAACYAGSKDRIVLVRVDLRNPLVFDWRIKRSTLDPEHPANKLVQSLTEVYGDPVHGTSEGRRTAAVRWREGLLSKGHDSVVVFRKPSELEVAVFDPERSVRELLFVPSEVL